jgi:hypothetical protein
MGGSATAEIKMRIRLPQPLIPDPQSYFPYIHLFPVVITP